MDKQKTIHTHKQIAVSWPRVFLAIALITTVVGALFATKTLANIEKKIEEAKEDDRPANLELTKITISDCVDCFNVDDAIAQLKKQNISISEEKTIAYDSPEGKALIEQFDIKRVPTYILTGEVAKKSFEGFAESNGTLQEKTFVFTNVPPVFVDTQTQKEMGKVTVTYLTDSSCPQCMNPTFTIEAYKNAGIQITEEKEIEWSSSEGQSLINKYKITKVPTFLLSSDIGFYEEVKNNWDRIGTIEQDETYIARNLFLPYRDIEKGEVLGLIDVVYLTDSTCPDCYSPQDTHKNILTQGFGVGIRSERTVDTFSIEGKRLVSHYNITSVPTVLLSPEVDPYANLKSVWPNVGTVEEDGWYVFRTVQQVGNIIYKDLSTNQVIRPAQPTANTNQ
ncbi:hypothetical protein COU87_03535 [Candidatus Roizmanbacteria bacterium CG10_big_fil_rev_8_21_14_0_10_39_12]|uniref:Thioredoxin domain-containing protein n=1 Tax=Candidatus Roizmanbacteria bacterium CG10_big_fil_rev_8_21_14_0_10_39_12 TaxID=1974852 RepID=A0A2M8KNZ5_9BACT|nr:MAG: hypothetical protein COU87_03535 [Candidatus Roizmanbacteria bacterium CG10_big_fil_rev_8_21_14_0_10_39_12]